MKKRVSLYLLTIFLFSSITYAMESLQEEKKIKKTSIEQVEIFAEEGLESLRMQLLEDIEKFEHGEIDLPRISVRPEAVAIYIKKNFIEVPIDEEISLTETLQRLKEKDITSYHNVIRMMLKRVNNDELSGAVSSLEQLKKEKKEHQQESRHKKKKKRKKKIRSHSNKVSKNSTELQETKLFLELMTVMKEKYADDLKEKDKKDKYQKIALWLTGGGLLATIVGILPTVLS